MPHQPAAVWCVDSTGPVHILTSAPSIEHSCIRTCVWRTKTSAAKKDAVVSETAIDRDWPPHVYRDQHSCPHMCVTEHHISASHCMTAGPLHLPCLFIQRGLWVVRAKKTVIFRLHSIFRRNHRSQETIFPKNCCWCVFTITMAFWDPSSNAYPRFNREWRIVQLKSPNHVHGDILEQ